MSARRPATSVPLRPAGPAAKFDPDTALQHLRTVDPVLAEVIARVGPYALARHRENSLFAALLRSIVFQQLHARAASAILQRVLATLRAAGGVTPETLATVDDASLRAAGLSANKLRAVRDLAAKCLDGTVPTIASARRLPDAELVERLTAVRGIGPWTVHMLLIFHLARPDVLPTGDFAIRLAFRKIYRKRTGGLVAALTHHAVRWQPYRSVASWYLWRSLD